MLAWTPKVRRIMAQNIQEELERQLLYMLLVSGKAEPCAGWVWQLQGGMSSKMT